MSLEDLISIKDAAALLRGDPDTVRRWGAQQFFPMFRLGKRNLRVKRADIEAFAAAGAERVHTYKPRGYPRTARPLGGENAAGAVRQHVTKEIEHG